LRSPYYDIAQNKKVELTKSIILRQLGHLGLLRPVTVRPHLAKGLALSWNQLFVPVGVNETFISILDAFQNVVACKLEIFFKYSCGCCCCKGNGQGIFGVLHEMTKIGRFQKHDYEMHLPRFDGHLK